MARSQTNKTTLYLAIACGVLVLILAAVTLVVYTSGGDPSLPGGVAIAAAAATAEAARRRTAAREEVSAVQKTVIKTTGEIKENKVAADKTAGAVPGEVDKMTDEQLKGEGNRLFGGGK